MLTKEKYPILEFDDNKEAIINPSHIQKNLNCEMLVITFFKEVIIKLLEDKKIFLYDTVSGENDLIIYKFRDDDVLIIHGTIGCPACAGFLDDLIGMGVKKVVFCGGGGTLDKDFMVGNLLVVNGAIRDEGFSYHYVKPSRIIYANVDVKKIICDYLYSKKIPYKEGLVWTTDAFYRETKDLVKYRREEGAVIVEMEQAGCIAVSEARNIKYGAIIYSGDDVSSDVWDNRGWKNRSEIRYSLVNLCKEIVKNIK